MYIYKLNCNICWRRIFFFFFCSLYVTADVDRLQTGPTIQYKFTDPWCNYFVWKNSTSLPIISQLIGTQKIKVSKTGDLISNFSSKSKVFTTWAFFETFYLNPYYSNNLVIYSHFKTQPENII